MLALGLLLWARTTLADETPHPEQRPRACEVAGEDDGAQARANALFDRGRTLAREGDTGGACACFEASQRLAPGRGGTLLNLGKCRAELGELVPAYEALGEALRVAVRDGRRDRERMARTQLRAVESALAWLALVGPADRADARVDFQLDGASVPRERWEAVPVAPGDHVLVIVSDRAIPQRIAITLKASERRTVHVASLARPAAEPGPRAQMEVRPLGAPPSDSAPQPKRAHRLRMAALTVAVTALVVGMGTGAWAIADKVRLERHCDQGQCPAKWLAVADQGHTLAVASGTTLALGAASSLCMWIVSARARRPEAQTNASFRRGDMRWIDATSVSF